MGQHGLPTRPVNTGIQNDTRVYGRVDGPCIEPKVTGASSYVVPRPNHNLWKAMPLHSWFVSMVSVIPRFNTAAYFAGSCSTGAVYGHPMY